ncbi:MAG: 3-deoxy-8-phosphooctulonate synthase [Bacteroidales bacterium]|jgi:2-dehydro-3-deoxyphosphooctonate aldolase (KDO 8-P synthase)|nr:3-deoxy-8-phosphooctulonate synthase [Bacteroidales bacterium]
MNIYQILPNLPFEKENNFFLMAGPCVVENETLPFEIAVYLQKITSQLRVPFIFKASYRKANRSRIDSFTGIGDMKALQLLSQIGQQLQIPVVTDIHSAEEAQLAAKYVDILQIPAFLCRQTDLLLAAAKTGKPVNVKKGQFLSAESMQFVAEKVRSFGNHKIMLTERGTMFGYQDLVVDFRSIPIMQQNDCPVIVDVTHSLQQPNQNSGVSGGQPDKIALIAKAGIACGADGIFMETHPDIDNAKSDKFNMLPLQNVENLLKNLVKIRKSII